MLTNQVVFEKLNIKVSTITKNIIDGNKITTIPNIMILYGKNISIQLLVEWR